LTLSGTTTLKYLSVDKAGNAETVQSQQIQIDGVPPTTTALCNTGVCSTGWATGGVSVSLSATDDTGGAGVAATYYTTDGSTPSRSSTVYTGAFSVSSTATVKYFSVDSAGNAEAVKSQLVQIDATPPTTTVRCNGASCATTAYAGAVSVTLSAVDNAGGSGVGSTHFTTDGSNPSLTSPTYTGAFSVTTTRTVRYRSWDTAGNSEGVKSQTIQIAQDVAPVARLTVTPGSGVAPLAVVADASASTDTDATPIATYTFNFGDGTAAVTQASPQASHKFTQTGPFTVSVTATDTANLTSAKVNQKVSVTKK
jgi:hypothetical protein